MIKQEAGDQGDRMMLWESHNNGASWQKHDSHGTFGTYGEMYPRFLRLNDGRLLLTFTVRSNATDGHTLGLRAIVSYDDGETWNFAHDRIVIDAQNVGPSGGGFGSTIQLDDGTLISCYSYRGSDGKTHVEAARWRLPRSRLNGIEGIVKLMNHGAKDLQDVGIVPSSEHSISWLSDSVVR